MELDRLYSPEGHCNKHHKTGTSLQPSGEKETRAGQKKKNIGDPTLKDLETFGITMVDALSSKVEMRIKPSESKTPGTLGRRLDGRIMVVADVTHLTGSEMYL